MVNSRRTDAFVGASRGVTREYHDRFSRFLSVEIRSAKIGARSSEIEGALVAARPRRGRTKMAGQRRAVRLIKRPLAGKKIDKIASLRTAAFIRHPISTTYFAISPPYSRPWRSPFPLSLPFATPGLFSGLTCSFRFSFLPSFGGGGWQSRARSRSLLLLSLARTLARSLVELRRIATRW